MNFICLVGALVLSPLAMQAQDAAAAQAKPAIALGAPFRDDAILQREMKVPVWGWSKPGTMVTVEFAGQKKSATAGEDGKWMLELDPLKASFEPATMVIQESGVSGQEAGKKLILNNLLVGEVWLASGQSNMQWPVSKTTSKELTVEPRSDGVVPIREFTVSSVTAQLHPIEKANGAWLSGGYGSYSAIAFAFAHKLYHELNVPIGILNGSFSETSIQSWTPRVGFRDGEDDRTKAIYQKKNRAYPIIKELCETWEDFLIEWPDGSLVSPASISPEHGPKAEGNSYEQQLVYDLFTNYIELSKALGVDEEFRNKVETMRGRLLGPKIGKWGQLQEWAEDIDDPKNTHRHLSHLIAVHPGRRISPVTTPELAEAAKVSMNARGDGGTGWSKAWKVAIWARLHDGDRAYKLLGEFIKNNVYWNLFGFHPPFQIDCNFGYAAGVYEMLVQSHMGDVHLLPALPKAWPTGSITGLRVRGGLELDMSWKDGSLESATIRNITDTPRTFIVRHGDKTQSITLAANESKVLEK